MTLWRYGKEDIPSILLVLLLPLLVASPQLLGFFNADPMLYVADMAKGVVGGLLPGKPYIDPNNGYGTQALVYRAALDWLEGTVPWWNPYSGVGLPLAAEYQAQAFFPLTLLHLLPHGMAWQQVALQVLSGMGTFALLRQLGLGRLASTAGGLLYAFNGTLAWFSHAPATPVPFLPWLLLGIERARVKTKMGLPRGWRILALAMALSLLSSFPETAYISGLLALAWAVLRGVQMPRGLRRDYGTRIALGGIVGIALAAPQVFPFLQFLPDAFIGGHTEFAHAALNPEAVIPTLIAPYAFGPIFAYMGQWPLLWNIWGSVGGYVTLALLVMAAYGFSARRSALHWLLLAWIVLALGKTFHIEPAVTLLNLVPAISITAFARYAQPSWQLALVILAATGLDELARSGFAQRRARMAAGIVFGVAVFGGAAYGFHLWPHLRDSVHLRNWALGSFALALLTAFACLALLRLASPRRAASAIAALLVADAVLMYAIPTLSNPRGGEVNMPAIDFLRDNLGLQRFYTLGPIQPNYGAYFGIASINHNYLPVSRRWVEWVRGNLAKTPDSVVFNGEFATAPGQPTAADELRRNLRNYEWVGVKYVVAPGHFHPFIEHPDVKRTYFDGLMGIFELPDPKPYFEGVSGPCTVEAQGRTRVTASCEAPGTLVRRELFSPGWTATVNGREAPISVHRDLFQSIEIPAGKSDVRYRYAPPHVEWAWLAAFIAALALLAPARKP